MRISEGPYDQPDTVGVLWIFNCRIPGCGVSEEVKHQSPYGCEVLKPKAPEGWVAFNARWICPKHKLILRVDDTVVHGEDRHEGAKMTHLQRMYRAEVMMHPANFNNSSPWRSKKALYYKREWHIEITPLLLGSFHGSLSRYETHGIPREDLVWDEQGAARDKS